MKLLDKIDINKCLINKIDVLLLLILTIFLIFYLYFVIPIPIAPDEQVPDFFSSLLLEHNEFGYTPTKSLAFVNGLKTTPNGFWLNQMTGKIIGGTFPGFIYLSALFKSMNINIYYINPILSVLSLFIFYATIKRLLNRNIALLTIIFLGISPIYLHWSTLAYPDMSSLFYFLLIIYLYVLSHERKNLGVMILIGILMGWWIFMRYTNAIYFPIFLFLVYNKSKIRSFMGDNLILIVSFGLVLCSLFIFNKTYYNSYITIPSAVNTGETLTTGFNFISDNIIIKSPLIKLSAIFKNAFLYFNYLVPLLFLILLPVVKTLKTRKIQSFLFIVSIFMVSTYFFYIGGKSFYWSSSHYSYYRYLLPLFVILTPLLSLSICRNINKSAKPLIILTFVILSIFYTFNMPYDAFDIRQSKLDHLEFQDEIMGYISVNNSVILTGHWAKIMDPKIELIYIGTTVTSTNITSEHLVPTIDGLLQNNTSIFLIPFTNQEYKLKRELDVMYTINMLKEINGQIYDIKIYEIKPK